MDKSALTVLQYMMYDSLNFDRDSMRLWLANMETYGAEMALAFDYLDEGDENAALGILDDAPTKLNLNPIQMSDLGEVYNLFNLLAKHTLRNLAIEETNTLEAIAAGAGEYAPGLAENILQLGGKLSYPRLCGASGDIGFKKSADSQISAVESQDILVFPNPAEDRVIFQLLRESTMPQTIRITDISGALIKEIEIDPYGNIVEWEVQFIPNGIYFYRFKNGENNSFQGKIIVQH